MSSSKIVIQPSVSQAIRVARVACIFFMIYVHVHPGTAEFAPQVEGVRAFDFLRFFIVDSFGRASVALLSVIAGYLAVQSLARHSYMEFARGKARSLLVPLVIWNAFFLAAVLLANRLTGESQSSSIEGNATFARFPELVLNIYGVPANEPLSFLRDLFVCALMTPLLLTVVRKGSLPFVIAVSSVSAVAIVAPLVLRPSIFVLYSMGVFIGASGKVPFPGLKLTLAAGALFATLGVLLAVGEIAHAKGDVSSTWLDAGFTAIRLPAAVLFWSVALLLTRLRAGIELQKLEPYVFVAFCFHLIVSKAVWTFWQPLFGGYYGDLYFLFYLGVPVVVFAAAVVFVNLLNHLAPALLLIMNGGRIVAKDDPGRTVRSGRFNRGAQEATP